MIIADAIHEKPISVQPETYLPSGSRAEKRRLSAARPSAMQEEQNTSATQNLYEYTKSNQKELNVEVCYKTGDVVIKMTSKKDGRVVREIHSKPSAPGLLLNATI